MIGYLRKRGRVFHAIVGENRDSAKEISLGVKTERNARRKLAEIEAALESGGGLQAKSIRDAGKKPLSEHVEDFCADLQGMGRSAKYIRIMGQRCAILIRECGWQYSRNITADGFSTWRNTKSGILSLPTLNQYLEYFSTFLCWMVDHDRMTANPLLGKVKKAETGGAHIFERRAYTEDEIFRLIAVLPPHLVAAVVVSVYTGLRRGELEQLQWGDVYLDEAVPCLRVRASTTKNHKKAVQGLGFAALLLRSLKPQDAKADTPVFGRLPRMRDLMQYWKAAGIVYQDAQGRRADFHSLRHTLATMLAKNGVSQRVAQEIMRHSDPRLTAMIYTDASQLPTGGAIAGLTDFTQKLPHILPHGLDTKGHILGQPETIESKNGKEQVLAVEAGRHILEHSDMSTNMVAGAGFEHTTFRL